MWAMAIPAAVSAISGILGSSSAEKKQRAAVNEANALLGSGLNANLEDLGGYRNLGERGLRSYGDLLNIGRFGAEDFQEDPGYQFRLQQGEKMRTRNALARGKYYAPSTMKGLEDFGQGLASQEYGNAFDRWRAENSGMLERAGGAVGIGQRAVESGNSDRRAFIGQMAGNRVGLGNAQAAASQQRYGAVSDAANTIGNWMGGQNALSRFRPTQSFGTWRNPMYTGRSGGEEG